ncbi:MAG: hypothetical protein IPH04_19120 [Saprospirales bacterium]|nr:hypothetical protein [Saprospirales bacterium]
MLVTSDGTVNAKVPADENVCEPAPTFTMPVVDDKKYVSVLLVAAEALLPQDPITWSAPPRVSVVAADVVAFGNPAIAVPFMDRFPFIVIAPPNVFVSERKVHPPIIGVA